QGEDCATTLGVSVEDLCRCRAVLARSAGDDAKGDGGSEYRVRVGLSAYDRRHAGNDAARGRAAAAGEEFDSWGERAADIRAVTCHPLERVRARPKIPTRGLAFAFRTTKLLYRIRTGLSGGRRPAASSFHSVLPLVA